jgi:hypothetical protein
MADKRVVSAAAGGVCSVSILAECFPVSVLFIHAKQPQPGAIVEGDDYWILGDDMQILIISMTIVIKVSMTVRLRVVIFCL